ncbi:MAG TPA: hypothetical protein VK209_09850 [Candidatus Sulfotelmatobacter sp.]|nr:hypothetical protein [Candidatus Sulfotelmatobacter sp.]
MAGIINPRTIRFLFNLALAFEPLAPRAITFYLSRQLGNLEHKGYIEDYKVKTKRIHRFHYTVFLDMDVTPAQTHYALAHMLPRRIKFLRRWLSD